MVRNDLLVTVPSFFKCPISLDVMKSPVSLCTGVTYDRSSIQTWLDNGNNTCPATMQPLYSKDLIPNSTLQRLINSWESHPHQLALKLLSNLQSQKNPAASSAAVVDSLRKVSDFLERYEKEDRQFLINAGCVAAVFGLVVSGSGSSSSVEELEVAVAVVRVLCLVLLEKRDAVKSAAASAGELNRLSAMLVLVLEKGGLDSRIDAARVLESLIVVEDDESSSSSNSCFRSVAEREGVLSELFGLMSSQSGDSRAVDAGLSCLIAVSGRRKMRSQIVRLGVVSAIGKLLWNASDSSVVEKALKMLEKVSTCAEGRKAICDDKECIAAIVQRMLKVSTAGTERAVVVLWSLCHLFRDGKAQEAVISTNGLTKILLLMQSDCSPAVRQMARDLVKIFRVNSKSCLSGYDTKTTHIMPF